jgi:outer membrane autotransporter protein
VDFGQIIASGDVTLSGTLQAVINPLSFSGTGLTEYVYEDVIVGDSLSGDFVSDQVAGGSAFYTLSHVIDGNTVDLRMTRNPFTSTSCSDNGNRLAQLLEQQFQGGNLTPEEQALFTFLLQLPPGEVCGAFDDIGGSRQADLGALVVETAGPWKSLVNDRVNGLGAVGCNLASSSGSCFNRFAANETGATQVMTDATPGQDPFDWLQTGTRRVGDTASWGRLVGVWGGTDSKPGVGGMDFALTGAIMGVDHVFAEDILAGVALQYTTDDLSFSGNSDDADIDSFEVGAYASFGDTRLYLNINTSFIWHDFNVQRQISAGGAFADYSGTTLSAYMELGKIFETEDMRIQPVLALSFADLDTDAYRETGFALAKLNVDGAAFTSLKSMIGSRFAFPIELDSGRKMIPEARVVWTHEFADNQSSFLAALQTDPGNKFLVEGREYARDSLVLGAGVTAPVSGEASLTLDYDASINPDITTHTLSAGVRVKW